MKTVAELLCATAATESASADFIAENHRGLALIRPLNEQARTWLSAQVIGESSWVGDALVVEMRFFPAMADAIIDAGFVFEVDRSLN